MLHIVELISAPPCTKTDEDTERQLVYTLVKFTPSLSLYAGVRYRHLFWKRKLVRAHTGSRVPSSVRD